MTHYVIRFRGELWWRPNRSGYTSELMGAGVYGEAEARRIESRRPKDDKAVSLVEALQGLEQHTVGAFLGATDYVNIQEGAATLVRLRAESQKVEEA